MGSRDRAGRTAEQVALEQGFHDVVALIQFAEKNLKQREASAESEKVPSWIGDN